MVKPNIHVPLKYYGMINERKRFGEILATEGEIFSFKDPHSYLMGIHLVEGPTFSFPDLSEFLQAYVIYPIDYSIHRQMITANPYAPPVLLKVIHTSDLKSAVAYALGLLEKGAEYGVWADKHNS